MHDHDDDLIAELAGGHLSGSEMEEATAAIGSCPRCRSELEAQLFARTSARSLPQPELNDFERSRIHYVISQQASASRAWYVRLAPALGAAAALVLVAGIGVTLVSDRDLVGDVSQEAAAEAPAEPQAEAAAPEAPAAGAAEGGTTEEAAPLRAAAPPRPVDFGTLTENQLSQQLEIIAEQLVGEEDASATAFSEAVPSLAPECSEDAGGDHVGNAEFDGLTVELYRIDQNRAVAYESGSCEIIAQYP